MLESKSDTQSLFRPGHFLLITITTSMTQGTMLETNMAILEKLISISQLPGDLEQPQVGMEFTQSSNILTTRGS